MSHFKFVICLIFRLTFRLSSSSSAEGGGGSGLRILQKLGNILNPQSNELQQLNTLSPVPSESSMSMLYIKYYFEVWNITELFQGVNRAAQQKPHLQLALSVSRFRGGIKSEK